MKAAMIIILAIIKAPCVSFMFTPLAAAFTEAFVALLACLCSAFHWFISPASQNF